jgi:rhamnose utilization protein RhaD (predicted bifunctional aldolase and dehydrogenase)
MAPARAWEAHRPAWETPDARRARRGPLYPDHVAYLGRSPIPLVHPDSAVGHVLDWRRRVDRLPDFLLLGNAGALVSPDAGDSVEPMLECLGMVSARLDPQADLAYLTAADEDALLDWDPEIHRVETARNRR